MNERENNAVSVQHGQTKLSARGYPVLILLGIALVVVSNFYQTYLVERRLAEIAQVGLAEHANRQAEHRAIQEALDKSTCIQSLTIDERLKFRLSYLPGAWNRMCPWIK